MAVAQRGTGGGGVLVAVGEMFTPSMKKAVAVASMPERFWLSGSEKVAVISTSPVASVVEPSLASSVPLTEIESITGLMRSSRFVP